MEKKTNYGKIFAITLAIVAGVCTVAYTVMRLYRKFFFFDDLEDDLLAEDGVEPEIEIETPDGEEVPVEEEQQG